MQTRNKYGSVPDLPDEELADPDELERQVFMEEWGPILMLPVRGAPKFRPEVDEDGFVKGAFGTVDFERICPKFDKLRYKVDKLREERRDVWITIDTVRYRVRDSDKYALVKDALKRRMDIEDISDEDVRALVRLYRRAQRLTEEIERLRKARQRRQEREVAAMLARWE